LSYSTTAGKVAHGVWYIQHGVWYIQQKKYITRNISSASKNRSNHAGFMGVQPVKHRKIKGKFRSGQYNISYTKKYRKLGKKQLFCDPEPENVNPCLPARGDAAQGAGRGCPTVRIWTPGLPPEVP
jgi:hypothetical protein